MIIYYEILVLFDAHDIRFFLTLLFLTTSFYSIKNNDTYNLYGIGKYIFLNQIAC